MRILPSNQMGQAPPPHKKNGGLEQQQDRPWQMDLVLS